MKSTRTVLLVAGAIAYILLPMDIVPEFIPFLGEIDDIFLLVLALQRLIGNAGRAVLLEHWMGDPQDLSSLNLERVLAAAAFFLPRRVRRRLRTITASYGRRMHSAGTTRGAPCSTRGGRRSAWRR